MQLNKNPNAGRLKNVKRISIINKITWNSNTGIDFQAQGILLFQIRFKQNIIGGIVKQVLNKPIHSLWKKD